MNYILSITTSIILVFIFQEIIKFIIKFIHDDVGYKLTKIKNRKKGYRNKELLKSIDSYISYENIRNNMKYLTSIVSYFESLFIVFIMVFLFSDLYFSIEKIFIFVQIIGGYLGIKTIGSFGQWNDLYLGRTNFYLFLIGSIINIIFSLLIGVLVITVSNICL